MKLIGKTKVLVSLISILSILLLGKVEAITIPQDKGFKNIEAFIGQWEMKTIVTSSNCSEVIIGSTTESKLIIKKKNHNNILEAIWQGGIWSSSSSTLKPLTNKEALTQRVTNLKLNDDNEWKAELIDHLFQEDESTIYSESLVKQYKNDILIGEYKTFSVLKKAE